MAGRLIETYLKNFASSLHPFFFFFSPTQCLRFLLFLNVCVIVIPQCLSKQQQTDRTNFSRKASHVPPLRGLYDHWGRERLPKMFYTKC